MSKAVSNNSNDFYRHSIYDKWEANRDGIVRHIANKKDIGSLSKSGYIHIFVTDQGIRKNYYKHRFIFECFNGKINDAKLVVDHINNIKIDNRIENLQLITHSQNQKKENPKGKNLAPIKVRATNLNSGESFDYCSIYKCSKDLDINIGSIHRVLKGSTKSATSKKDKKKYTFKRI